MSYKTSIIIPTRHRSELLKQRLETIGKHTPELGDTAELVIAFDEDDKNTEELVTKHPLVDRWVVCKPLEIPAVKWNTAAKQTKCDWLVTISDDCIPQEGWLTNALHHPNQGFVGLPDGVTGRRNDYFTPLYMATREWLRKYHGGVLVIPKYKSWFADIETAMRAHRSGTYTVCNDAVVTQLHSIFSTAPDDEIYKIGEMRRAEDLAMYNLRASYDFPNDFAGVL